MRREGPHRLTQKRPLTLVSALQRLAAAEFAYIRRSRNFRRLSIFDFFNSISQKQTSPKKETVRRRLLN
jgi:hypothetical protein